MRVLLISHTCQSRAEGHGRAAALAKLADIELLVVTPNRWRHYGKWRSAQTPHPDEFHMRVEPVALPWAGPAQCYLHFYPGMRRIIAGFAPDIIDLWEEPWALVSLQACRLRDRVAPAAKILVETEQNISRALPAPFQQIRGRVLRSADYVVGRSAEAVQVARSMGYFGPAGVIGNAVDETLFRPMDKGQCKQALGIDPRSFIAGYVGRLIEEKGVMDLLEAVAGCPASVECVFVGEGPMRSELVSRAESLGIGNRVHMLGGKTAEELPATLNALDALVLMSRTTPTWKEQFGRVIIEAHACGVPVIGSNSGAISSVIGEAGIVVREADVRALGAAISELQANPAMGVALGRVGVEQVKRDYTWISQARQYASAFRLIDSATEHRTIARSAPAG